MHTHIHIYIYTYTHTHMYTYGSMNAYTNKQICVYIYVYMTISTYIYIFIYTLYVCIHVFICVYTCRCIYTNLRFVCVHSLLLLPLSLLLLLLLSIITIGIRMSVIQIYKEACSGTILALHIRVRPWYPAQQRMPSNTLELPTNQAPYCRPQVVGRLLEGHPQTGPLIYRNSHLSRQSQGMMFPTPLAECETALFSSLLEPLRLFFVCFLDSLQAQASTAPNQALPGPQEDPQQLRPIKAKAFYV